MKISPVKSVTNFAGRSIDYNINFKGLFIDKSLENDGNWRMEYSPYSWETKNWNIDSKMASQSCIDIYGNELPDNEKIYSAIENKKSAKDILGTEFYYEYNNGKVKKRIIEIPAMNREASLKVYNTKLKKFLDMKIEKALSLQKSIITTPNKHRKDVINFYERAADLKHNYFNRRYTIQDSSKVMKNKFDKMKDSIDYITNQFKDYVTLRDSSEQVKKRILKNEAEINLLASKRKSGQLIDISRRDVCNPNKPLYDAMQNLKDVAEKYVSLPHKTISFQEILNQVDKNVKEVDLPNLVIKYIENIIKKRI